MSEDQTKSNQTTPENQIDGPTEAEMLAALKTKATTLNIKFSNNIGMEALREKINAAMEEPTKPAVQEFPVDLSLISEASVASVTVAEPVEDLPLTPAQIRKKQRDEQMKLVRVRIANMNPSKADLHGEIVTVRTKFLGIIKEFVPFGEATDDGWHLPNLIYQELKDRKFLQMKVQKSKNGAQMLPKTRWVPEFSLEVLPDLKPDEIKKLAAQQAAAAGLAD